MIGLGGLGPGPEGSGTYVWADDGGDDRSWYDDAADSKAGEDEETPGAVERIGPQTSHSADAWGVQVSRFRPTEDYHDIFDTHPLS